MLVEDSAKPRPHVVRVSVLAGAKLMPQVHPEGRIHTVISGFFPCRHRRRICTAEAGGTPHFHGARSGGYVTQLSGTVPLGIEYVRAGDDPRQK